MSSVINDAKREESYPLKDKEELYITPRWDPATQNDCRDNKNQKLNKAKMTEIRENVLYKLG